MLKIEPRYNISVQKKSMILLSSLILAFLISSLVLLFKGYNPLLVYYTMLKGTLSSTTRIREVIILATPLIILSMGVLFAFKMKFWNIGADGQFIIGAIFGSYFALYHSDLPSYLLIPVELLAGFVGGALWGFIPAFFRARYKTNETIFTLLMNYIALQIITWLQYGPWKSKNSFGFPKIDMFADSSILPMLWNTPTGLIIAIFICILGYIYFKYSKSGFELSIVGESEHTARYLGISIKKVIIKNMLIGAGICGVAGIIEAIGTAQTLYVNISNNMGYTAIAIAWLSKLQAKYILLTSFLFSILIQGVNYIQLALNIPFAMANMLEGLILFSVLGSSFFINYKINYRRNPDN